MFTGIIEEVGRVKAITSSQAGMRLTISSEKLRNLAKLGDSIAINGVCLTVTDILSDSLSFDAVPESMRRTTLGLLKAGDRVNLEDAVRVGEPMGGHIVQGHVDAIGTVRRLMDEGVSIRLSVDLEPDSLRYVVPKGSICVDGVSLTVADLTTSGFAVAIIPTTWRETVLAERGVGSSVNIETDVLGRYVERLLSGSTSNSVSEESLRRAGF
ncbi:MAG: riboflavin synthase [Armatimonadota bacterium]